MQVPLTRQLLGANAYRWRRRPKAGLCESSLTHTWPALTLSKFPNSYSSTNPASRAPAFAGKEVAEAPWRAASNIVSRQSHWSHEGERSEYDQVRELYKRVMTQEKRNHLHANTAKLLKVNQSLFSQELKVMLTHL